MTPQEWINKARTVDEMEEHTEWILDEGAQHLAAALDEIARLQAERVVVPECGYRFDTCCMCAVPSSRVLKDGEVAVGEAELAALREFANGWSELRQQFDAIACEHGWEYAMERVAERFPEIDTLDALRAQGKEQKQ